MDQRWRAPEWLRKLYCQNLMASEAAAGYYLFVALYTFAARVREAAMHRLLADVDVIRQVPGWSLDG